MTNPPALDKARHLKYWTRCLRSPLPQQYTGNDSARLLLGFFIVGAVELLTLPSGMYMRKYMSFIYAVVMCGVRASSKVETIDAHTSRLTKCA